MSDLQTGEVLTRYFGHESLKPGQSEVIERVMNLSNTLAVLPTGGGKSLCYQLPSHVYAGPEHCYFSFDCFDARSGGKFDKERGSLCANRFDKLGRGV